MAIVNDPTHVPVPAEFFHPEAGVSRKPADRLRRPGRPRRAMLFWIVSMVLLAALVLADLLFTWFR